ncbi:hypothetical protein [Roseobacter sp.]|uniref:hypothetical protein n=1 Tax=Roseobacter sp. TaxID=1907202 RepID=UPI00329A1ABE
MFNFTDFFKNLTANLSEFSQSNGVGNVAGVSGTGNTGIGNGNDNVGGFNGNNNGNGNTGGGFNGNGNGVGNNDEGNGESFSSFDLTEFLDDSAVSDAGAETVAEPVVTEDAIEITTPAILQSEPTDTFEFVSTNGADNIGGVNGTGNTGIENGNGNVGGFNGNNNGGDFNGNGNVGGGVNGNGNSNSNADVDFTAFLPVEEIQTWQDFVPDWDSFFA